MGVLSVGALPTTALITIFSKGSGTSASGTPAEILLSAPYRARTCCLFFEGQGIRAVCGSWIPFVLRLKTRI